MVVAGDKTPLALCSPSLLPCDTRTHMYPCAGFEKALEGQLAAGAAYSESITWSKMWSLLRVPSNWIIVLQVGVCTGFRLWGGPALRQPVGLQSPSFRQRPCSVCVCVWCHVRTSYVL